ncbi:MAG: hypothetical protein M4D80_35065 [Myxococcota bacterium]|nr:VWA domain-containing protein [Deltaproteobacteria bacterium]MDQ3340408.1 hypothetical protein [Myxococcota bacterium]
MPRRDIDILFVIDDSGSMKEEQDSLRANFSRFIGVLESLDGGLPNVQIGVITPNLGVTAIDGSKGPQIGNCLDSDNERGELRTLGLGGPRFLRDVARAGGGRDTNYGAQTLAQAFSQLADVGSTGCGIEQHLEATKRALDGNPVNAGFVRDGAYLAVILIADEDDCSLANATLFSGTTNGDILNFRCTKEGVACDTPATPFEMATGRREDCHPREDSTTIAPISRYVDFLKTKKSDARDVIVAGILGDPEPFEIVTKPMVTTNVLGRSCTYNGPTGEQFAFPAVRTANFLAQFPNTARTTICDADLSDGLEQIGIQLRKTIIDACFDYELADVDADEPGAQYDCSVTEVRRHPNAPDEELRTLPACGSGQTPCWRIEEAPTECAYTDTSPHLKLAIDRGGQAPTPDIRVKASCVTADSSGPFQ